MVVEGLFVRPSGFRASSAVAAQPTFDDRYETGRMRGDRPTDRPQGGCCLDGQTATGERASDLVGRIGHVRSLLLRSVRMLRFKPYMDDDQILIQINHR